MASSTRSVEFKQVSWPVRSVQAAVWFTRRKPLGAFGATIVIAMIFMASFADILAPYSPYLTDGRSRLLPPSPAHWFGTDDFGRDVLARVIYGARTSLLIAIGVVSTGTVLATVIGITTGLFGGLYDLIVQRIVDAMQAMPGLVIAMAILSVLTPNYLTMTLVLAIIFVAGPSRVIRSATLGIRGNEYVTGAVAIGCTNLRIILYYILPNIFAPVMVVASVAMGATILIEASLSFLGFGIPPPAPSWGQMLTLSAREYMLVRPTLALFPGLFITLAVFGFNMFGDALRDVLDPRLRGR